LSPKAADVVLVVVTDDLRSAYLQESHHGFAYSLASHRHDNTSTDSTMPYDDDGETSLGLILLRSLRTEAVLGATSAKRLCVRFDYTPDRTDVDRDLALGQLIDKCLAVNREIL